MSRRRGRRALLLALGIAVSATFVWLSFRKVELGDVGEEIGRVSVGILAIALVPKLGTFLLAAARSRLLFAPLADVSYGRLVKSVLAAFAVNNVVPFRAGELARVGYLAHYAKVPASTCLAIIAVERLVDALCLLAMFLCLLPAIATDLPMNASFYVLGVGLLGAVGGAWWVSRHPGGFVKLCAWCTRPFGKAVSAFIERKAETFAEGLAALKSGRAVVGVIAVTVAFWLVAAGTIRVYLWAFDLSVPWYAPLLILAFLAFGLAVPSTPGHIGTYHFFVISALTTMGIEGAQATSYAVVAHAMAVLPFTLLAVPVLLGDYLELQRAREAGSG